VPVVDTYLTILPQRKSNTLSTLQNSINTVHTNVPITDSNNHMQICLSQQLDFTASFDTINGFNSVFGNIQEIRVRLNKADYEQKQLNFDLLKLQQQWQLLLEEQALIQSDGKSYPSQQVQKQATFEPITQVVYKKQGVGYSQTKENSKKLVCANCTIVGHTLEHCVRQEDDGFIHGCPRCNARENDFDDCIHMDHKDLYFLVKLRDGRPTIRTDKDYRHMSGFGGVNERPWTPEFSKKHLNHHKSYEYKARLSESIVVPDPAWLQEDKIPAGSLATPTLVRMQQMHSVYHEAHQLRVTRNQYPSCPEYHRRSTMQTLSRIFR
jgi:hypothetical protein